MIIIRMLCISKDKEGFQNRAGRKYVYFFRNTCRALFEHHKLLFSFHMCIKILNAQGKIVHPEYVFLLKGGVILDRENQIDNPCSGILDTDFPQLNNLFKHILKFSHIPEHIQQTS